MRDKNTNKSRCFGFVVFKEESTVDYIMKTDNHYLNGKRFECKVAVPKEVINKPISFEEKSNTIENGSNLNNNNSNNFLLFPNCTVPELAGYWIINNNQNLAKSIILNKFLIKNQTIRGLNSSAFSNVGNNDLNKYQEISENTNNNYYSIYNNIYLNLNLKEINSQMPQTEETPTSEIINTKVSCHKMVVKRNKEKLAKFDNDNKYKTKSFAKTMNKYKEESTDSTLFFSNKPTEFDKDYWEKYLKYKLVNSTGLNIPKSITKEMDWMYKIKLPDFMVKRNLVGWDM